MNVSRGASLFQAHLRGGLNRDGELICVCVSVWWGGRGILIWQTNVETTMISILHKELEVREVLGHAAEDQNQIRTSSC